MSPLVEVQAPPNGVGGANGEIPTESLLLSSPERPPAERHEDSPNATPPSSRNPPQRSVATASQTSEGVMSVSDTEPMTSSPEVSSTDLMEGGEVGTLRRGRSGTFIAPRPPPPEKPAGQLRRVESVREKEKDKEKKNWLGRKVSVKKEGDKEGLMRRLTGRKATK